VSRHLARWFGQWQRLAAAAVEGLLRPYAQVVFSRDRVAGALVLAAVATRPSLACITLAAVIVAAGVTWLLGLGGSAVREGGYGCVALLTVLALVAFPPQGGPVIPLLLIGVVAAVLFGAALQTLFFRLALPTYVLPFVAATWLVHLLGRALPPRTSAWPLLTPCWVVPSGWAAWLDVPADLLFLSGALPGALVLLALLVHSRIGCCLAALGTLAATAVRLVLRPDGAANALDTLAAFNALLTAMAVGGIWFVPQPSAVALATAAAGFSALVTYAFAPALGALGLPVLSLPFAVTLLTVLSAARMRERDRWPRSALPAERPEESLARHQARVRRFGDLAWLPFRLPFRGEWFVSQGWDGEHTHQGAWRHGLDFEGRTAQGSAHRGEGRELRDYVCYGLPVLAAGVGTVALVVDGVDDNRPGEVNTRDNWGNAVVIAHGPALFSVYAHLVPKSLRVRPGDVVTTGMELGRCGSSGRSAVPHLHFQVQRTAALGSPTVPFEMGDVIERPVGSAIFRTHTVPRQGCYVRSVQRDAGIAQALGFAAGSVLELRERDGGRVEVVHVEIDLLGARTLRSPRGRLSFEIDDTGLVLLDSHVAADSLLRPLALAWARVPFDACAQLCWQDRLSRRWFWPRWSRVIADLLAVAAPPSWHGRETFCRLKRTEAGVELEASGPGWQCASFISFSTPAAPHVITVEQGGSTHSIEIRKRELPDCEVAAA
jgi:urea transporter